MTDQQHRFALEILDRLPLDGWNTVLDIGAGPGYQTQWFLDHGKEAWAVDLAAPILPVPFVRADAHALPQADSSVDAVWTHHAFEHMRDPLGALMEVSRVLRPGGWLFFTVPDTDGVISSGHINRYDMALVVYHLAMCGFDAANGHFGKYRSHLRAAVRKIDTPATLDTTVTSLWKRGRLPASVGNDVTKTGRFSNSSLSTTWLDGSKHHYR